MISDDMQDFSKMFKVMGVIYACCAFGHKLDNAFGETNDALKHLDWYKFPMQIWKQLPTVIAAAQQPAELKFIGSIPCTREGYKNVRTLVKLSIYDFHLIIFAIFRSIKQLAIIL